MNARTLIVKALSDVVQSGQSLNRVLPKYSTQLTPQDAAFFQEVVCGTLRHWHTLEAVLNKLVEKPLKAKDANVKHVLMSGLYQIKHMRVPQYAAVSESVATIKVLNKTWAKGLVNAVLRNYQRNGDAIEDAIHHHLSAKFAHPFWIIEKIREAYADSWQSILQANNQRPPMCLRVNERKTQRAHYLKLLQQAEISGHLTHHAQEGICLDTPVSVEYLPNFKQGWVSVQDQAAQFAATLLAAESGSRVLDVCAAPGGKSAHIMESSNDIHLVAIDIDPQRVKLIHENFERLSLHGEIRQGDACAVSEWWDGVPFERILLDAPCSASGVIRRHPDIKLLRKADDLQGLTKIQWQILRSVWPLLKTGGMLLYATCSILPEENEIQIERFLKVHDDARHRQIEASWGSAKKFGRQVLPGQDNMDGFYYACIEKC